MSTNYINKITDTGGTTHDIAEGVDTRIFRATCSTAANTAAKVATLDDATGYSLAAGVRVAVTFTYGNSAATPTLNVNSGGAKNITVPTSVTALTSGNGTTYNTWGPHETVIFTYSGSYWVSGGSSRSIYNAYVSNAHAHGNITSGGDITATAPTIANGDQLIINDHSASKITNGPTFDGSTTTTALTPKGTWETFSKFSGSYNDLSNKPTIPTVPTNVSAFTNDAGYITSADIPEGSAASTTTPKMDGTAAIGTELAFARGDHVHPSDTSRVPTSRTVNGKALSANITLSASDVGALPDSTVVPTISDTYDSDSSDGMSGKAVGSAISGAFSNHWDEQTTMYYVMVSGGSASIINTNGGPVSYQEFVMATSSAHSAFFVQPINSTYMRSYVPVSLDSGGLNVILTAVEGRTTHVVNVADGGSGLVGVHYEVTSPTLVSQLSNDAGFVTADEVYSPSMYQASGASNTSTALTAGTITQVTLVSTNAVSVGSGFSISEGGIKCQNAGTYKISGAVFMSASKSSGVTAKQAFIRKGSAFSSATEVHSATDTIDVGTTAAASGTVSITPKLLQVSANEIIFLACRTVTGAGTYYPGNSATFLLVERVA